MTGEVNAVQHLGAGRSGQRLRDAEEFLELKTDKILPISFLFLLLKEETRDLGPEPEQEDN